MLYVKTVLRESTIHGIGLFAAEPIKKDTLIFRWEGAFGWRTPKDEFARLPEMARNFLWMYGWRAKNDDWLCDIDDTRFVNHSSSPNMLVSVQDEITSVAARDIQVGEELTEDYSDVWRPADKTRK